jgi:hypothetical protein
MTPGEEQQRLKRRNDSIGCLATVALIFLLSQCARELGESGGRAPVDREASSWVGSASTGTTASGLIESGTLRDWTEVSQNDRIRVASTIAARLGRSGPRASEQMGSCLRAAYAPETADRPLSEIAAACAVQLRWAR